MLQSIKAGKIVDWKSKPTLSEGTAGGVEQNSITFPFCKNLVDHWEVVCEKDIKWGVDFMWRTERKIVEGAAGMALAAARNMGNDIQGKTVCVILCGGNIDKTVVEEIASEFT